jgi:hypothetical protein
MKKSELKKLVKLLAQSQGFYGRLLRDIEESDNSEEIWQYLEEKNFKDPVDFILFLEQ